MPHDNDYYKKYQAARTAISHGTDGPVTKFVAISRACRYSADHPDSVEATANALYEVLEDGVEEPMDVTCARCGEPWDTYHLRHDEVHETSAGQAWIDWQLDKEEFDKLPPGMKKRAPAPKSPVVEQWTGRLTDFWREQFAELGWKFGSSVVVVLTCPCCKDQEALPDAAERTELRTMLGELLEGDEDGLSVELEDLDHGGY